MPNGQKVAGDGAGALLPVEPTSVGRPLSSKSLAVHASLALCALIAGTWLILRHLHYNCFWIDELYTLHAINLPVREMILERIARGHFPLYFLALKGFVSALADEPSETVMRGFSVLFWVLAVVSFLPMATTRADKRGAALAVTLFALNGLAARQAVESRMYTLVLFEAVWVARAYLSLVEGSPRRRLWGTIFVIAMVAAWWTSASFAILSVALVYDAWRRRRASPRLLRLVLVGVGIAVLSLLPGAFLHLDTRQQKEISHVRPTEALLHLGTFLVGPAGQDHYYRETGRLHAAQAVAALLALAIMISLWRNRRAMSETTRTFCRIVFIPIALMIVTAPTPFSVLGPGRYLMGTLPFAALLSGETISAWFRNRRPWPGLAAHMFLLLFGILSAHSILRVQTEGFRYLTDLLDHYYEPNDAVVVVPDQIIDGVRMYAGRVPVDVALNRWILDREELKKIFVGLEKHEHIWVLWYRGRESPAVDVARELFGPPVFSSSMKKRIGILRLYAFAGKAH